MFRLTLIVACLLHATLSDPPSNDWYKNAIVYQVYPRSFKDSTGNGIGDLNGITSKLEHIANIGVTAFWLSPIYESPQVDFGYDISNYTRVNPEYGTLDDFDRLVAKAKSLGLKVILDFVPNHTSDRSAWFQRSIQKIKPYDEYYVWKDAKMVNGVRQPPNNWLSNFQGSAWSWNDVRKQYYLHQFAAGQPDLNYRSGKLRQEMQNVLTFWLHRGVDGFRIDVMNHLVEDDRFLDEPSANRTDIPKDDYDSLDHVYTRDRQENYEILRSWRSLLDSYSNRTNSDMRMLLTEAYSTRQSVVKYYSYGSTVPFNFVMITDLNNQSTAADFKKSIDDWMSSKLPNNSVPNWVVGNHDNHRVASRYGPVRADQMYMLAMMLPGVTVVYNGDEIGMEDRFFTYDETIDPAGRNAGPNRYYLKSRDPERTPYQWDNSVSAGFSVNKTTWLPVNSNYRTLNLEAQRMDNASHYNVFRSMVLLKNTYVVSSGNFSVSVVDQYVLGVVRRMGQTVVALLINFGKGPITINARKALDLPYSMKIYAASVGSDLRRGSWVYPMSLTLPGAATVAYITPNLL